MMGCEQKSASCGSVVFSIFFRIKMIRSFMQKVKNKPQFLKIVEG